MLFVITLDASRPSHEGPNLLPIRFAILAVNVAVSCAGIAPVRKTLSQKVREDGTVSHRLHSLAEFKKAMEVNVEGTFNMARLAADRMARRSEDGDGLRGCIINTASVAAYDGQVGQVAYASSKGAVVAMTLPVARDLAPLGIRMMTVAPGLFMTPLLAGLPEKVHKELVKNVPCPNRLGDPIEYARVSLVQFCTISLYLLLTPSIMCN